MNASRARTYFVRLHETVADDESQDSQFFYDAPPPLLREAVLRLHSDATPLPAWMSGDLTTFGEYAQHMLSQWDASPDVELSEPEQAVWTGLTR